VSSITVDSVTHRFRSKRRDVVALENVSLEIEDSSFTCLVGASGCGKSTLLNIMAGLVRNTAGSVSLDGKIVEGPGPERGMVFQSYALYPWLKVRDNIEFGLSLSGTSPKARRHISENLLTELNLVEFANSYPHELSGGMQQRVAIARALANEPKVLLMDEPFGALDALTRASAQQFLTQLWSDHKRTIVFVTHDVEEALILADRIVVLSPRPGRVREVVDVPFERPRTAALTTSAEFGHAKERILNLIFEGSS